MLKPLESPVKFQNQQLKKNEHIKLPVKKIPPPIAPKPTSISSGDSISITKNTVQQSHQSESTSSKFALFNYKQLVSLSFNLKKLYILIYLKSI